MIKKVVLLLVLFTSPFAVKATDVADVLSVRLSTRTVTSITLEVGHYTYMGEQVEDGTITGIEVERDTESSFNNPHAWAFSIAELIDEGNYDSDSDEFLVKIPDLTGVKGYYFQVRFIAADDSVGDWTASSRYVTLPPKVKDLRVPSGKKEIRSARLKWDHPTRCESEGCVYEVKVYKNSDDTLLSTKTAYHVNYVDVTGLAAGKKYYFKVLSCLDYSVCRKKFSDTKTFKTNSE